MAAAHENESASKPEWIVDPTIHLPEALGLLKDWVTTLLTLQTSMIAAVAAFVGFKDATALKTISTTQAALLIFVATCSFLSIFGGVYLLNALPAAAQRKPSDPLRPNPNDLFSIVTSARNWYDPMGGRSIVYLTQWFRAFFLLALVGLVAFAAIRLSGH